MQKFPTAKVTEIFCMADGSCREFAQVREKEYMAGPLLVGGYRPFFRLFSAFPFGICRRSAIFVRPQGEGRPAPRLPDSPGKGGEAGR